MGFQPCALPINRLERRGQERGHFLRFDDDAILAVDRKDAADEQRLEPQHRHVPAGAVAHALEPLGTRDDVQQLRVARLVREARRPQRNVEARALYAISAGALEIGRATRDRKSTRLNSSHLVIAYAVFGLPTNNKSL